MNVPMESIVLKQNTRKTGGRNLKLSLALPALLLRNSRVMKFCDRIPFCVPVFKKLPALSRVMALIVLMLFCDICCFSQSDTAAKPMNSKIQEEELTGIKSRIAAAGDNFVLLTSDEYDLLLFQPVGKIDGFDSLTSTGGGIKVGIGFPEGPKIYKTNIQIIFPGIPNIDPAAVFVIFDSVKGSNGLDYLDRESNTENGEKDFTQVQLDKRNTGTESYWFGSRYVNLRDPSDDLTVRAFGALGGEITLSRVSGKVIMYLPVNLNGDTVRKEYSFAFGT